jgi:F-type H+-transporting ATPase subunit b
MLIDWFTVSAQALNFIILVWLLKRFLYRPILEAVDAREKRIASERADADAKMTQAQKEHAEYQRKNEEFDQQRAALLTQATQEVGAERKRLLDETRTQADALAATREKTLQSTLRSLSQSIRSRTQQEVFAIARKTLADLATTTLEERMGEVFNRRLRAMSGKEKAVLAQALRTGSEPALVRSAFELPAEQRALVQNAVNETFSADVRIRFEAVPELVSGIELTANGQKIAWSIADYLASLERSVAQLLQQNETPQPEVAAKAELTRAPTPNKPVADAISS